MKFLPKSLDPLATVFGEVPIAVYHRSGLRQTFNSPEWVDRLPRTWDGQQYRVEVIYNDQAHAALGNTTEEAVGWLIAGVLGVHLAFESS